MARKLGESRTTVIESLPLNPCPTGPRPMSAGRHHLEVDLLQVVRPPDKMLALVETVVAQAR
jgi:hypothetical protein